MADRTPDVFNRLSAARTAARRLQLPPELVRLRDAYRAAAYECEDILETARERNVELRLRDESFVQRKRDRFHDAADTLAAMYSPLERLVIGEPGGDTTRRLRGLRSTARIGAARKSRRLTPTTA